MCYEDHFKILLDTFQLTKCVHLSFQKIADKLYMASSRKFTC